jgi:hypothetical protein
MLSLATRLVGNAFIFRFISEFFTWSSDYKTFLSINDYLITDLGFKLTYFEFQDLYLGMFGQN